MDRSEGFIELTVKPVAAGANMLKIWIMKTSSLAISIIALGLAALMQNPPRQGSFVSGVPERDQRLPITGREPEFASLPRPPGSREKPTPFQIEIERETRLLQHLDSNPGATELRLRLLGARLKDHEIRTLISTVESSSQEGDKRVLALYLLSKSTRKEATDFMIRLARSPRDLPGAAHRVDTPQVQLAVTLREFAKTVVDRSRLESTYVSLQTTDNELRAAKLQTPQCFDAKMAKRFMSQFQISSEEFDFADLCNQNSSGVQVLESLRTIEAAQFREMERPHPLDVGIVNEPYFEFLKSRIKKIANRGCASDDGVIACVRPQEPIMRLQSLFFDLKTPSIVRVSTVIHEAKHIEGFTHVDCVAGPLAGSSGGCDLSFRQKGAYAVELEFYTRVALRGSNFHPAVKALARSTAIALMEENFNERPAKSVQALAFTDFKDGHLVIFDGLKIQHFPKAIARHSKLIARNTGLAILPFERTESAWFFDPYSGAKLPTESVKNVIGGTLRSYNDLAPRERPPIKDILNRVDLQGRLFEDRIEFSLQPLERGDDVLIRKLDTRNSKIVGFAASDFCWRPHPVFGSPGFLPIQVLNDRGELFKVDELYSESPVLTKLECPLPEATRSIVSFEGNFLGLMKDGTIRTFTRDGDPTTQIEALRDLRAADLTSFPIYLDLKSQL